jgi:hypothetical protein
MNIKTEFEQFLAGKAEEFVSKKANMTIAEFRELNAVLDSCGIDFSNLPSLVELPATQPVLYHHKSKITAKAITDFILSSVTGGNMVTRKELYNSIDIHFGDSLTPIDYARSTTGMTSIKTRLYTKTRDLLAEGKLAEFKSKDGKIYFHRLRSQKATTEQQLTVTL